jgi:hypothetical protein
VTRDKLKALLEQYGRVALWTYLVIWLAVLAGFAVAISLGFRSQSTEGSAGVLLGAWVATKLTQPLRIAATLALTPVVAAIIQKWRRTPPKPTPTDGASE